MDTAKTVGKGMKMTDKQIIEKETALLEAKGWKVELLGSSKILYGHQRKNMNMSKKVICHLSKQGQKSISSGWQSSIGEVFRVAAAKIKE